MPYLQGDRIIGVSTPLGQDKLMLTGVDGVESISEPFSFHLKLAAEDGSINLEGLLRKPFVVHLRRQDDSERIIHGLVNRIQQLGMDTADEPIYYYKAEIVPWLWFLNLNTDIRIFQNKKVQDILTEVFQKAGFTDFNFKLQGAYPPREYCVQYRESDFDFVSRLMEEEGIFYYFIHAADKHTLVLADQVSVTKNAPGSYKVPYGKGTGTNTAGLISDLVEEHRARLGKITLNDFDFQKSTVRLEVAEAGKSPAELYDYPGGYKIRDEGSRYARIKLEEQEARLRTVRGDGTASTLIPGYRFELTDHFNGALNRSYLVTRVEHKASTNVHKTEAEGKDQKDYACQFEALPFGVPYRPAHRTPKPIVHGVQTAIVVGPSGEELWVDKFGRVKVHFHWDRLGKRDESSSCWIRTSQAWAGAGWGHIQLPRIGQEVVVSFLEGDPDRPLITGRVYNDQNMPPYDLPGNQTQSGIKSRSSKNGGKANFNEFRFEDKQGSEQVYLHAEKDLDIFVEEQMTITVDKKDHITTINKGNQSETVKMGNKTTEVSMGNCEETVKMGNKTTNVNLGNYEEKVGVGKYTLSAMTGVEITCGLAKISMTPASIDIEVGAAKVSLNPAMVIIQAPIVKIN